MPSEVEPKQRRWGGVGRGGVEKRYGRFGMGTRGGSRGLGWKSGLAAVACWVGWFGVGVGWVGGGGGGVWCGVVCYGAARCGVVRRGAVSVQKNAIEAARPLLQGSGSSAMRRGRKGTENIKNGAMSARSEQEWW